MIFLGVGSDPSPPLDPHMETHSSDVLLMVWRCACHVFWTLSSNYFFVTFYELMIQLHVDICILDTILMLPEFGPKSGALATVGEFVLMT